MKEGDPKNLICGITIDVTPLYPSAKIKKRCRSKLWDGDEISSKLRSVLERGAITSMTRLIKSRFESPSYLRVHATATADEWTDEGDDCEVFALEIDVFGEAHLLGSVSDIVGDIATAKAVCADLHPLLGSYATEFIPDVMLKWKLEPTEYGE